ncbi:MAG: glycosyltransferase family 4 protein [Chloroflexota bacterium]
MASTATPEPVPAPAPAARAPQRVTLVISSLEMGGAERVMTELANHWVTLGWTITIIHYSPPSKPPAYPLDPRISVVPLGLHRESHSPVSAVRNNVHRIRAVRRAIRETRPEVVLSFMANVITMLATLGLGVPVLVSEHRGPRGELSLPWSILREVTYRRAVFVVMLTHSALAHLSPTLRRRGRVVPNPLPSSFLAREVRVEPTEGAMAAGPVIMGLGRLGPEKGFDLLIRAFARITGEWPTARLVIWGEGDERRNLEALVAELGLGGQVSLPGTTPVPEDELLAATVFVLSSRKEGLPMALIEAMALGRAVVACDCDHGPRDIITDGVDGLLVPPEDVDALADAIGGLLRDDARRASLARGAMAVRERFTIEAVSSRWEALFREAVRR